MTSRYRHIPNILTIARIVATPILLVFLFSESLTGKLVATILFILASISDYYDGQLARKYGVPSRFGRFLDPLADKILVLGTFVALAALVPHIVPWWAVAILLVRDVAITLVRVWSEYHGKSVRTLPMAKTKTTFQLIFLIGMLVMLTAERVPGLLGQIGTWVLASWIPMAVLMIVVAITTYTGILYFYRLEYTS